MSRYILLILIAFVALGGCTKHRNAESKEAIQKAVEAYLQQRSNLALANMSVEVAEVKFEGETATAEVRFRSKESANVAVTIQYKLKRHGDGWQVEKTSPSGGSQGSPHGQIQPSPPASTHGETGLEPSH